MQAEPPQGEVVIVVGPGTPEQTNADADEIEATARRWLAEGQAPAEVARAIAGAFGMTKRQAYKVVVSLRRDDAGTRRCRTSARLRLDAVEVYSSLSVSRRSSSRMIVSASSGTTSHTTFSIASLAIVRSSSSLRLAIAADAGSGGTAAADSG